MKQLLDPINLTLAVGIAVSASIVTVQIFQVFVFPKWRKSK